MTGYAAAEPVPRTAPHHYVTHVEWCPVCGRERTDITRMAGPRPRDPDPIKDWQLTHIYDERYDWCEG